MAQLQVTLVEAKNLKQKDKFSENDPFVEFYLEKHQSKQKSHTKKNCNNPTWNETFLFNHLHGQDTLHADVFDKDAITSEKIGSVQIDLRRLYEKGHLDEWFNIPDKTGSHSHGEVHLILSYERLKV